MAQTASSFHWADYLVFTLLLLLSCIIGIYYAFTGGKQKSSKEYLMADRKMHIIPSSISTVMTLLSSILVLGVPAEVYIYGTEFWLYSFGIVVAFLLSAVLFVPLLYPLHLTSSYEYLELRFQSRAAKITGSMLLIISMVVTQGITIYGPATALEGVTGFPAWGSMLCISLIAIFYTTLGGLKAVVWADTLQSVIMVGGIIAILIVGTMEVGGIEQVWKINEAGGRVHFFNFDPDPTIRHSFWSLLFGGMCAWLPLTAVTQTSVQRFSMLPSLKEARWTVILSAPGTFLLLTLFCLSGMVLYAFFSDCDPLRHPDKQQRLKNPNQLIPYFVMQALGWPGVPGVFLAVLFSATLSTLSSLLNATVAVLWEDFIKGCVPNLKESKKVVVLKIMVVIFGVVGIATGFLAKQVGGTLIKVAVMFKSGTGSPILGMFLLGGLFPWANWLGAVIGGIVGLIFPMWINIGALITKPYSPKLNTSIAGCISNVLLQSNTTTPWPSVTLKLNSTLLSTTPLTYTAHQIDGISRLYTVSYMWIPAIGIATTVIVGLVVSLVSAPFIDAPKADKVDRQYLIPIFDRLFCCLPERFRKHCRCGHETHNNQNDGNSKENINGVLLHINDNEEKTRF